MLDAPTECDGAEAAPLIALFAAHLRLLSPDSRPGPLMCTVLELVIGALKVFLMRTPQEPVICTPHEPVICTPHEPVIGTPHEPVIGTPHEPVNCTRHGTLDGHPPGPDDRSPR